MMRTQAGLSGEGSSELQDQLRRDAGWTRRLARSLLGDDSAGEDASQEAWLRARRHPPDVTAPLGPWVRATVRNNLLNQARRYHQTVKRQLSREVSLQGGANSSIRPEYKCVVIGFL